MCVKEHGLLLLTFYETCMCVFFLMFLPSRRTHLVDFTRILRAQIFEYFRTMKRVVGSIMELVKQNTCTPTETFFQFPISPKLAHNAFAISAFCNSTKWFKSGKGFLSVSDYRVHQVKST